MITCDAESVPQTGRPQPETGLDLTRCTSTTRAIRGRTSPLPCARHGGFAHLSDAIRKAVGSIDPHPSGAATDRRPAQRHERQRNLHVIVRALVFFATAGLLLAALGVYGVVAHAAVQLRTEFGIRLALGATPAAVSALVMGQGGRLALAGVVCGCAGAWGFTRVRESTLPRVTEPGLGVSLSVAGIIALVSVAASWIPALRAGSINPIAALRSD